MFSVLHSDNCIKVNKNECMITTLPVLLDVVRIDHYEQRLKALCYKKKFNERITDVKHKVEGE